MTWFELIYWTVLTPLVVFFVFVLVVSYNDGSFFVMIPLYLFVSFLVMGGFSLSSDWVETSSEPINVAHGEIFGDRLIILTEGGKRLEFEDYESVNNWKRNEPLIQTTYFSKVKFGPDSRKVEYTFK